MSEYKKACRMLIDFAALLMFIYLLIRPSEVGKSVESGISFCIRVIIPSLFVFLVLSRMFMGGVLSVFGKSLPITLIIGGILCGFPVGAKIVRQLYEKNLLTKKQSEVLVSCSDNASASFIISFAGANILGSVKAGFLLLIGKFIVSLIWYCFASRTYLDEEERHFAPLRGLGSVSLSEAVKDSARTMADICACVIFFMCVGEVVKSFLPDYELVRSAVRGFFEFSGGIELCRYMKPGTGYIITAMLLGWSGMCVHMQVSIAVGGKISIRLYLINKIIECLLMGVFAVLTKTLAF
ncbi:MAG: hypothetical protein PHW77_02930 [Eubacteriales bacterium]|nr:hypothetical protein [Eubacteriales bacterium]